MLTFNLEAARRARRHVPGCYTHLTSPLIHRHLAFQTLGECLNLLPPFYHSQFYWCQNDLFFFFFILRFFLAMPVRFDYVLHVYSSQTCGVRSDQLRTRGVTLHCTSFVMGNCLSLVFWSMVAKV